MLRENLRGVRVLVSDVKTGEMFRSATQGFLPRDKQP